MPIEQLLVGHACEQLAKPDSAPLSTSTCLYYAGICCSIPSRLNCLEASIHKNMFVEVAVCFGSDVQLMLCST